MSRVADLLARKRAASIVAMGTGEPVPTRDVADLERLTEKYRGAIKP